MLEPLIVCRAEEYHDLHLLSSEAVVHNLVASTLVPETMQLRRDSLDRIAVATLTTSHSLEWCGITLSACQ